MTVLRSSCGGCFIEASPWCVNASELLNWLDKVRRELEDAPFIGMIVKEPPPPHVAFDLYVDVQKEYQPKQNPEFCAWFRSLPDNEVTEAAEGDTAYRIVRITPLCTVEKVSSVSGEWKRLNNTKEQDG